jgi:hypothetical protein
MAAEDLQTGVQPSPPEGEQAQQPEGQVQEPQTVPVEAVNSIREEMRQLKAEMQNKDMTIQFLQNQISKQIPKEQSRINDDDLVSHADVERIVAERMQNAEIDRQRRQYAQMAAQARKDHPDYDEMIRLSDEVIKMNPDLAVAVFGDPQRGIRGMENPFEGAYRLAVMHDSYKDKLKTQETKNAGQKIADNLNRQRTLAEIGSGGGPAPAAPSWREQAVKNPQVLEDHLRELMSGKKVS